MKEILQEGPHYMVQVPAQEGLVWDMVPTLSHEGEPLGGI
jgi:hypothetical protein